MCFQTNGCPPDNRKSHRIDAEQLLDRLETYVAEHSHLLSQSVRVDGPRIERGSEGEAEVSCWLWVGNEPVIVIEILFRREGTDLYSTDAVITEFEQRFTEALKSPKIHARPPC